MNQTTRSFMHCVTRKVVRVIAFSRTHLVCRKLEAINKSSLTKLANKIAIHLSAASSVAFDSEERNSSFRRLMQLRRDLKRDAHTSHASLSQQLEQIPSIIKLLCEHMTRMLNAYTYFRLIGLERILFVETK